jgi:hypothetical protein
MTKKELLPLKMFVSLLASYLLFRIVFVQGITQYNYGYVIYIAVIGIAVYIMPLLSGGLALAAGLFFVFLPYGSEAAFIFLGMAFLAFVSRNRRKVEQ